MPLSRNDLKSLALMQWAETPCICFTQHLVQGFPWPVCYYPEEWQVCGQSILRVILG